MASNELIIRINGDVKNFTDALDTAKKKSEDLNQTLGNITRVAAVGFAAFTAEIGLSVKAFGESEKATTQLTQALQNQGIYSKELLETYQEQATRLQNLTGISDEATLAAQRVAQGFLGQIEVTDELVLAIADLSTKMGGDMERAAEVLSKSIGTNTNMLGRYGIEIDSNVSKQERMRQAIEGVSQLMGGQAIAAGNTLEGSIKKLGEAFGDAQELIGKNFAPAVKIAADAMTSLVKSFQNNENIVKITTALVAAGAATAGIITGLGLLAKGFLLAQAAAAAFGVALNGVTLGIRVAVGATGLGLIITTLTLVWQYYDQTVAITKGFVQSISTLFSGLGKIIYGVFNFDLATLKAGLAEVQNTISAGIDEGNKVYEQKLKERQAIEDAAEEEKKQKNIQRRNEENELILTDAEQKRELKRQQVEADFAQEEEFRQLSNEQKALLREEDKVALMDKIKTEQDIEREALVAQESARIEANNRQLADQKKHGAAYAQINRAMHSEIYQGTKQAFGELAQLQQSSNDKLKAIGKAAAVANIIIKTAESAMNIYNGFSTIPIIGPALGIAGAAAAIAFGAEQVRTVTAAATGGIITGGTPGRDSVPALLTPGELVAPVSNFEETIGSVRAMREAEKLGSNLGGNETNFNFYISGVIGEFTEDSKNQLAIAVADAVQFGNINSRGVFNNV